MRVQWPEFCVACIEGIEIFGLGSLAWLVALNLKCLTTVQDAQIIYYATFVYWQYLIEVVYFISIINLKISY